MADQSQGKNWWDSQLSWRDSDLEDTVPMGDRWLRNIPSTLRAYRLGKKSRIDELKPDPVERIKAPPPADKEQAERERLYNRIATKIERKKLTLQQLLDPDFCDYL